MYGFRKKGPSPLDELIEDVRTEMKTVGVMNEKYPTLLSHLKDLTEIKKEEDRYLFSPDVVFSTLGTAFVAGMIIVYEKANVTSSRAWSLVRPSRAH